MKLVRFAKGRSFMYGVLEGEVVKEILYAPFNGIVFSGEEYPLAELKLLAPCTPTNIVAVGLNYVQHSVEFGLPQVPDPLLFSKPASSVIGPGDLIVKPDDCQRLDYEAEMAVVIGKRCRCIKEEEANDYILGYTCLNDVTARDIQNRDSQWLRAKGFYTFCPVGPWIETEIDPSDLQVKAVLNGEVKQDDRTSNMMFSAQFLTAYVSSFMELQCGDIISTGTPGGIAPMKSGDKIEIYVEGIGSLINYIA